MSTANVSEGRQEKRECSRVFSILFSCAALLFGFTLAVVGLRIADPVAFLGYVAALAVLLAAWAIFKGHLMAWNEALSRESRLLVVGATVLAMTYPFLAENPYQVHVMAMGGIFALMAIGLNVNIGYAGLADFGYIAYYTIGAYASALLNVRLGVDFWICAAFAGFMAAALSTLVSFPALRVKGHYLALVTLGFCFIVIQLVTNLEWLTGGTQGLAGIAPPSIFGHSFRAPLVIGSIELPYQANYYYLVLGCLIVGAAICVRLGKSRWGRAWAAIQTDDVAAEASGLSLTKLKMLALCTGAAFGGVAGSFYAHMIGYIDPSSFRFIESVFLLAIVVLGNFRVGGVIAAAVIFTLLPEKLRAFDDWRLLIFGVALLVMMLLRGRRMVLRGG